MDYLDTSVIISVLTMEPTSESVERWLASRPPTELLVSDWTVTEVESALSRKVRKGEITETERALVRREFEALRESIQTVRVLREHFHAAARIAARHELGLRAADALHVAVAEASGATLWTRDRRMLEASSGLGIRTANPVDFKDR